MRRALISAGVVTAAFSALIVLQPGGDNLTPQVADVLEVLVAAIAATACLGTARAARGRSRRGWYLVGVSAASWALGQAIWTAYEIRGQQAPFPSAADASYLLAVPLMVVGLFTLPTTQRAER